MNTTRTHDEHTSTSTSEQTLTSEQAERIVREHGHETLTHPSGVLMGGILGVNVHTKEVGLDWSPVPLNVPDLRDWLGY